MEIKTTRFGRLQIDSRDVIQFPTGIPGLNECTSWVLLADAHNEALGWLQSLQQPDVALAVVSPKRFVPGYQLRVGRNELGAQLHDRLDELHVLAIVGKNHRGITLNLKAPLVIHLGEGVGRQVIANGDHPVQYELSHESPAWRQAA
jgi:flagellar assembly factor FliW